LVIAGKHADLPLRLCDAKQVTVPGFGFDGLVFDFLTMKNRKDMKE
jgi:hypothetical protein